MGWGPGGRITTFSANAPKWTVSMFSHVGLCNLLESHEKYSKNVANKCSKNVVKKDSKSVVKRSKT